MLSVNVGLSNLVKTFNLNIYIVTMHDICLSAEYFLVFQRPVSGQSSQSRAHKTGKYERLYKDLEKQVSQINLSLVDHLEPFIKLSRL